MGMQTRSTQGGHNNEPNVVPMIDVLLVLLVIFMLMVPLSRRVIDVQTPNSDQQTTQVDNSQIVLEVIPGDVYMINLQPVAKNDLAGKLHSIYDNRPDKVVFVKGDTAVSYQEVLTAMDIARGSGVRVIGIPPNDALPGETRRSG